MRTPYELETLGWKIKPIKSDKDYEYGNYDYYIAHAFHFPYGHELQNKTLPQVCEFIDNFIKENKEREDHLNDILDR